MSKPLLSIGIIFKNEIRCLERCLKSLDPLRNAIPCEVVMADTGSDDGSQEIAAKYADILFDFPWINDFSAARNAVMGRCSGKWYLSIDADEWLDPHIDELLRFLTGQHNFDFFGVKIRNYKSEDFEAGGLYMDSSANRIVRMSTGMRYQRAIHEYWDATGQPIIVLAHTMFYHDGYLYTDPVRHREKEERNMSILRRELEDNPDSPGMLLQCFESSYEFPEEHLDYIKRAMSAVEKKLGNWERCGPAIFRYAAATAMAEDLPEVDQWIAQAEELFPNSIVTRVDVNHTALGLCWNREDYAGCVRRGEAYFSAIRDYETGNYNIRDVTASPLSFASMDWQQTARRFLAPAYLCLEQPEKCAEMLREMFDNPMSESHVEEAVRTLTRLRAFTHVDTVPLVLALWEQVSAPVPSPEAIERRQGTFIDTGFITFKPDFRFEEDRKVLHPAYSVFLPLEGKCVLGGVAALYMAETLSELNEKFAAIEDMDEVPLWVLFHVLEQGGCFPLSGKLLSIEEMDSLASRLAQDEERFLPLVLHAAEDLDAEDWQSLTWVCSLLMAAVQIYPWSHDEQDKEQGMTLARAFAHMEKEFLPRCYTSEVLREDKLFALPPLHRFGWYCARAFDALGQGNPVEYVRLLRAGLDSWEGVKVMVEFLADHTAEVQQLLTPPELKVLADQIRVILARFSPDDPAVAALKQSEAYQKVAHLIEGMAVPVWGGLTQ